MGTAVGDALGAPVEGRRNTRSYVATLDRAPGRLSYTDDTAMTIALAESLLARGGFDGEHMAHTFARHYRAEPWRGYGASPPEVFAELERGVPWDQAAASLFGGTGSFGNGAAMRVAPVALFGHPDTRLVASLARDTAFITHTNPEGIDGAICQAVAVDRVLALTPDTVVEPGELIRAISPFLTTDVFRDKLSYLATSIGSHDIEDLAAALGTGISAQTSVPTALACFLINTDSFPDTIKAAISIGGDTDTIAAMAGAISGARLGLGAIPERWLEVEGHETLIDLAERLYSRHGTL